VTRALLAIVAAAGLALTGGACGLFANPAVVMVSGRDDHGDLQRRAIGLQVSPREATIAATALDGDIALVLRREGPWAHLRVVRSGEEGWVEDHYLRGEAVHHGATPRRVRLIGAEREDGGVRVRVRYADDASEAWVSASALKEVGAR
jgi:hypothetical protein